MGKNSQICKYLTSKATIFNSEYLLSLTYSCKKQVRAKFATKTTPVPSQALATAKFGKISQNALQPSQAQNEISDPSQKSTIHCKSKIKAKEEKMLLTYKTGLSNAFKVLKGKSKNHKGWRKTLGGYTEKRIGDLVRKPQNLEDLRMENGEKEGKKGEKLHYYYLYNPIKKDKGAQEETEVIDKDIQQAILDFTNPSQSSHTPKQNLQN